MCQEAMDRVIEMEHWGTLFPRTPEGKIAQRPFGGLDFPEPATPLTEPATISYTLCTSRSRPITFLFTKSGTLLL